MAGDEFEKIIKKFGTEMKNNFCGVYAADELKEGFIGCAKKMQKEIPSINRCLTPSLILITEKMGDNTGLA